jgi:hypothetical protein
MANIFDRVGNESTSTGTSDFTLGSAIPGLRSFNGSVTSGSYVPYLIVMGTEWEAGIGIFTAPSTLARTRIFGSSNSNAAVNWPAGTKGVYLTMPADLLDGLFPDAKGILTMIQTAPNAAPYLAKRKIKRRSGHPITINGTTDFDGSSGDFEIGLDTASAVKTYLGAYGLDDLVDAVKGWDIPFDAGFSPVWSAQDLEVRVYREMLAGRSFTYEKLVGKLLTPSSGQPVISRRKASRSSTPSRFSRRGRARSPRARWSRRRRPSMRKTGSPSRFCRSALGRRAPRCWSQ